MTDREKVQSAINTLSEMIISHSIMLASRQHRPTHDPDGDDEEIWAREHWVKELRAIRERLEDLVTGVVK